MAVTGDDNMAETELEMRVTTRTAARTLERAFTQSRTPTTAQRTNTVGTFHSDTRDQQTPGVLSDSQATHAHALLSRSAKQFFPDRKTGSLAR